VIESFGPFLLDCRAHFEFIRPYIDELGEKVDEEIKDN